MTQHNLIYKDFPSHAPLRVFNKKSQEAFGPGFGLNATTRQTESEIGPTSGIRGFPKNFTSKLNFSVSAQTHLWSSRNGKCLIREMLSNLWQEDWKSGTNVYNATMSYKIQSNPVAVIGKLKLFVIPFETGSSKYYLHQPILDRNVSFSSSQR